MSNRSLNAPERVPEPNRDCPRQPFTLRPTTVYWLSAIFTAIVIYRMVVSEGGPATVFQALTICAAIGAFVLLLTRRPLVSATLMLAHVLIITFASQVKLKHMNMVVHAYDLAYYLTSPSTLLYLLQHYSLEASLALAAIVLSVMTCVAAFRFDPVRVNRKVSAGAFLALAMSASAAAATAAERRHSQFEYEGMYMNSFYRSWAETIETWWRGQLIEAASHAVGPTLRVADSCEPTRKPPHVILIHQESTVPPAILPTLEYDKRLDRFFQSDDGNSYNLRVETYGGASVLTEFSVIAGLSTYSFGGMRLFVQRLMSGKIKETLPKVLKSCGYRTTLFYPMLKTFTFADKFFHGAGIDEIFDAKAQKARRVSERDRFYYGNLLDELDRHIADDPGKPMFAFVETMATHWPYDSTWEPQMDVPGGKPGTHPEMHEYLRRLWISSLDFDWLRSELDRRFPGEQFLIVRYGDHHPMSTRVLLGYGDGTEAEDVLLDRNSIGFKTFFAVNSVNFAPSRFESPQVLDVAYLGTILLEASGLPLPDTYKKRQQLKSICQGRSFDCPKREMVLNFHRQLLDAGLVSPR